MKFQIYLPHRGDNLKTIFIHGYLACRSNLTLCVLRKIIYIQLRVVEILNILWLILSGRISRVESKVYLAKCLE